MYRTKLVEKLVTLDMILNDEHIPDSYKKLARERRGELMSKASLSEIARSTVLIFETRKAA